MIHHPRPSPTEAFLPWRVGIAVLVAVATAASGARAVAAQDPVIGGGAARDTTPLTLTYRLHPLVTDTAAEPSPASPRSAAPAPLRVIQGPRFTWVLEDEATTARFPRRDDDTVPDPGRAELILDHGAPLLPGPGPLLVRGWPPPPDSAILDTLAVRLVRGDREREVDGREATHWQLDAAVAWSDTTRGSGRRIRVTGDLWLLPDLPFTWAGFGADRRSLPALLPAFRDSLAAELRPLGLVARADLRVEFSMRMGSIAIPAPEARTAFEISGLEVRPASAAPLAPAGPMIDRAIITALERLRREYPRRTCRTADDGELPAIMRARVDHQLWPPLIGFLTGRCRG